MPRLTPASPAARARAMKRVQEIKDFPARVVRGAKKVGGAVGEAMGKFNRGDYSFQSKPPKGHTYKMGRLVKMPNYDMRKVNSAAKKAFK